MRGAGGTRTPLVDVTETVDVAALAPTPFDVTATTEKE